MSKRYILQNVIVELGYNELGNTNFSDIVRAGVEQVEYLLSINFFRLEEVGFTTYLIIDDDDKELPSRDYIYQDFPKEVTPNYYISHKLDENNNIVQSKRNLVKSTYLFSQSKQPKSCLDILKKQNSIPFKIVPYALDFNRTNKSRTYDDNWQVETKSMREAVETHQDRTIYFGHYFDKRGRLYSDGYLLNYQGDEWQKSSLIPLVKLEKLTDEGKRQLNIALANEYGLDKLTYSERLSANLDNLKPKKPILAKTIKEHLDKESISFCVSIDATASGYQILSILANCYETAKYTNLIDSSKCYDLYGKACEKILDLTKSNKSVSDIRDIVKKSLMTRGYNSDKQIKVCQNELKKLKIDISLEELTDILDCSEKIIKVKTLINNCLIDTFSSLPDSEQIIRWTMPDGFIVEFGNIRKKIFRYKGKMFSTTIKYDSLGWDKKLNWRALMPNLIHSIDAYICREMIRRCNFQIVTIHDCFYSHPNHILDIRKTYIKILKEIQSMNILEYICKQINSDFKYQLDDELFEIVDDENSYCLC